MATSPSTSSSARLLAAVGRVCASTADGRELRAAVIDLVAGELPVDAYAFVLTDPETSVGVDPLASIPDLDELPRVIALKYTTPKHRWTSLRDVVSLATLPVAAHGAWQEYVVAQASWTLPRWCCATRTAAGASSTCGRRAARTTSVISGC